MQHGTRAQGGRGAECADELGDLHAHSALISAVRTSGGSWAMRAPPIRSARARPVPTHAERDGHHRHILPPVAVIGRSARGARGFPRHAPLPAPGSRPTAPRARRTPLETPSSGIRYSCINRCAVVRMTSATVGRAPRPGRRGPGAYRPSDRRARRSSPGSKIHCDHRVRPDYKSRSAWLPVSTRSSTNSVSLIS